MFLIFSSVSNALTLIYWRLSPLWKTVPTPRATPAQTISPSVPISKIELIPNETVGSNHIQFRVDFKEYIRGRVESKLTVNFTSSIVELSYGHRWLTIVNTSEDLVKILTFVIPVSGEYRISFYWLKERIGNFAVNVTFVSDLGPGQSSLVCYGEKYEARWCRATNICWRDRWFTFFGVPKALFSRAIMTPGSRPIPLDYPSCRKSVRFHTTSDLFPYGNAVEVVSELSFLTCRWYSMQYFWHSLFDYTLPLFWTAKLNGGVNKSSRIFTIDENTSKKGYQFISAFTNHEVVNIKVNEAENNNTCWRDIVLGFPKSEYDIQPEKWGTSMLELPYEYPLEAYKGFREHMISHFAGPDAIERCEPDPVHPRVVVAFRNATMRDIDNKEELVDALRSWCPHCRVDSCGYANETYGQQMRFFCNGSILISIHGSQLSHMVWMKVDDPQKPTAVIEVIPYMYTCRDWYEQIANGAQIKYFKWINTHIKNTRSGRSDPKKYEACLRGEMPCLGECHDFLRDQPTIVHLGEFKKVFMKALKHVSRK